MEELKLEKNISIPPIIKRGKKTILNELLPKLEVGDSFVASRDKYSNIKKASNKHGIKLTSRSIIGPSHDKDDFVRFWRVK
jgi:hypothetical protein